MCESITDNQFYRGMGKSGRSRLLRKQERVGSNPTLSTSSMGVEYSGVALETVFGSRPNTPTLLSGCSSVTWQRSRFGSGWLTPLQVQFLPPRPFCTHAADVYFTICRHIGTYDGVCSVTVCTSDCESERAVFDSRLTPQFSVARCVT